eukprot:NODE_110_length_18645_cov_0.794403.p17 type:complete len:121 gc:universal NODE_110_length_18645_cov_0.794403:14924-14562(-)
MDKTGASQRTIISVIGDEDTITGLLLAGVGHVDSKQRSNFLTVDNKTTQSQIEQAFAEYTTRKDIAILLINQHIANKIRHLLDDYHQAYPSVLEMPSKDHPYDPSKDSVLKRVNALFGNE